MTFSGELLLLLWVIGSLLLNGITLLRVLTKLRGLELFGYGAAAGVSLHALFGWAIAGAPTVRGPFVTLLIAPPALRAGYFVWRRVLQALWRELLVALSPGLGFSLVALLL